MKEQARAEVTSANLPRPPQTVDETVREALAADQPLSLVYRSAGGRLEDERTANPISMFERNGDAYLQAWCPDDRKTRIFRIDRIASARWLPKPARVPYREMSQEQRDASLRSGIAELLSSDDPKFAPGTPLAQGLASFLDGAKTEPSLETGKSDILLELGNIGDTGTEQVSQPDDHLEATKAELLGQVVVALAHMEEARNNAQTAVDGLREIGTSWREIGDGIGVSSQAAYSRWSPNGRELNRKNQAARRGGEA
jgi:hypothetical protein